MAPAEVWAKLQQINCCSERLQLVALSPVDKLLYCDVMTNPACMQYVGKVLAEGNAERSFNAALALNQQQPVTRFYFQVSLLNGGEPIGIASINQLDMAAGTVDIGRMLQAQWHGKGFGSELSRLLIRWLAAELSVVCITKHIRHDNVAAIQSAKKLGFSHVPDNARDGGATTCRYQLKLTSLC